MADAVIHSLHAHGFYGSVHPHGSRGYAKYRPVEIGECNFLYPLLVIRPVDERDVAVAVKAAKEHHVDIRSVIVFSHIIYAPFLKKFFKLA